jgi:hypothetical protein
MKRCGISSRRRVRTAWYGALILAGFAATAAQADSIDLGYMSFDVTGSGTAQLDIVNLTGPNSIALGDSSFPVTTAVSFDVTSLSLDFTDGSSKTFGSSYFTTSADGLSLDGSPVSIGGLSPGVLDATITGTFGTTALSLSGGGSATITPSFSATITDSAGALQDGDLALISATTTTSGGGGTTSVPEPDGLPLMLTGVGLLLVGALRRRYLRRSLAADCALGAAGVALTLSSSVASAAVGLSAAASPSSGAAGITSVNLTTSGLPSGVSAANVTVTLAPTCAAGATGPVAGQLTTTASSVKTVVGSVSRVQFVIPGSANQGTYYASVSGTSSSGAFASNSCAIVAVSHTTTSLSACVPTSSLAIATGTNVTAYVPQGSWGFGTSGIQVVPVEGTGSPSLISTPNLVNSCASNPASGETVCSANNSDVYTISGATLSKTLTSGTTGITSFSGGSCHNCGVAINALTNKAYITMGVSGSPSGSGIQSLDLATNTFGPVFPAAYQVSEDISIDPSRNFILSPNEAGIYDLFSLTSAGNISQEYGVANVGGEGDSAAEDCSTGIALSSLEFTGRVYIADLTQASFTSGTPGTWLAPAQVQTFPEMASFAAGTDGISVAPGSSHLGIVTGEFGGNAFGVIQLPTSSGTGVPAISDYAVAVLPPTPDGSIFSMGYDPHTITAYTSPNNGKPYGVVADWAPGTPSYLAVIDLTALMAAPRTGAHTVSATYDLVANGVVRYVATH